MREVPLYVLLFLAAETGVGAGQSGGDGSGFAVLTPAFGGGNLYLLLFLAAETCT